jgi:hypothetical protein
LRGLATPGDAVDPHQVRHDKVGCTRKHRVEQGTRAVEVLSEVNGRRQLARQLRVARHVVVDDGFLELIQMLVIERMTAVQRISKRQSLIEVAHQLHIFAQRATRGRNRREIIVKAISSQPQPQRCESSFANKGCRLSTQDRSQIGGSRIQLR